MNTDDLSFKLAITLGPRVYVNKINIFNQWVLQGIAFVNWVLNETYKYEIVDMRFLSCMN